MWYDCLEEFFDQSNEELLLKNRPITNKQEKQKFVICFDNVQDIISKHDEGKMFRSFLSHLLERCKNLHIILTSQKPLGRMSTAI